MLFYGDLLRRQGFHGGGNSIRRFISSHSITGTIPRFGRGVAVGQYAEVERIFKKSEVELFGDLINDKNLLHSTNVDWEKTLLEMPHIEALKDSGVIKFNEADPEKMQPLVHGIFIASMFSSIFGTLCPGCVYMNQSLNFVNAIHADEPVQAHLCIEKVRKWRKGGVVVQCATSASVNKNLETKMYETKAIQGIANVWLPSGHKKEQVSFEESLSCTPQ